MSWFLFSSLPVSVPVPASAFCFCLCFFSPFLFNGFCALPVPVVLFCFFIVRKDGCVIGHKIAIPWEGGRAFSILTHFSLSYSLA